MPLARAISVRRSCSARPVSPVSAKPELKTTAALTPFAAHSSRLAIALCAETAMIARSTGAGIALTLAKLGRPWTVSRPGLTG